MKPRILVADDEEGVRESLRLILSDDYDVTFAENGQEALTHLEQEQFDLAFLDIKMPKLDGLDVLKRLKGKAATPILMLTAYQSVELAKEAINLGARDYLSKPFGREQIFTAVRGVLQHSPLPRNE